MKNKTLSRRRFLGSILVAGAAPLILPNRLLGQSAPSRTLNLACVGIGNQGRIVSRRIGDHHRVRVVAVCDVDLDHERVAEVLNAFPDARRFHDFRKMFDEMDQDIDAVSICTPDHAHFPVAMHAISMGKHVYVEKPLAHTFRETEFLMAAAEKYGVVTQMGNQGHSGANYHQFKAYAEAGLLDGVNKVISFMNGNRRWHGWGEVTRFPEGEKAPGGLRWEHWHTTAEERPFSERYHPGNWRGWYRYGMGALGDWGPHILDTVHRFLDLGLPEKVELVHIKNHNRYIFPLESTLKFNFPARGEKPPVELYWYDGVENLPETPPEFENGSMGDVGKFLLGGKHSFLGGAVASPLRVIPEAERRAVQAELPSFSGGSNHYENFILSALGEEKCRSSFEISGPLNQVLNLGVIAQELGSSEALRFDRETKRFVDNDKANDLLVGAPPRQGWEHYYKL